MLRKRTLTVLLLLGLTPTLADATWSIIVVDTRTREVGIASATCLPGFDLKQGLPVVVVARGAAAAQSFIDTSGSNRRLIRDEFLLGTPPDVILEKLEAQDGLHRTRQYGIVDVLGRAATYTGRAAGEYANGFTGQVGELVYSIQGNVITGHPVLDAAEHAVLNTPGDLAEKLMVAMEAAASFGGDGRCSCQPDDAEACGSPPPQFDKSAHIAFLIVARRGDTDGGCAADIGCAAGKYTLAINIAGQRPQDPDPVIQLRERFEQWRAQQIGKLDLAVSRITITPDKLPADGKSTAIMDVELRDWQGNPITNDPLVLLAHDVPYGSAQSSSFTTIEKLSNSHYRTKLVAGTKTGVDLIGAQVQDGAPGKWLTPSSRLLLHHRRGDMNGDGEIDALDVPAFVLGLTNPEAFAAQYAHVAREVVGDVNRDERFDGFDIGPFVRLLGG